jgi:hypothetical protein
MTSFHHSQNPWRLLEAAIQKPIENFAIIGHFNKGINVGISFTSPSMEAAGGCISE